MDNRNRGQKENKRFEKREKSLFTTENIEIEMKYQFSKPKRKNCIKL